jgi:hypothetical protein
MTNFTPELIAKAKAAKSAEELMALASENNIVLTEDEAKTYFEQLHTNGAISDDELELVAGGGCFDFVEALLRRTSASTASTCANCGNTSAKTVYDNQLTPLPYESNDKAIDNNIIEHL